MFDAKITVDSFIRILLLLLLFLIIVRSLCYPENTASVHNKPWKNASCPATGYLANPLSTSSFKSRVKAENKWASQLSRSLADREMIHTTDFSPTRHFSLCNGAKLFVRKISRNICKWLNLYLCTFMCLNTNHWHSLLTALGKCHIYKWHTDSVTN